MIENGIFEALAADAGIGAILPSPAANNIYPLLMDKDYALPAIVFQGISSTSINSLDGENVTQSKRFQFDCYAKDYFTARKLSRAVKAVFIPVSDGSGQVTFPYQLPDGSQIQSAMVHMDIDSPFEEGEGGYVRRALLDVEFYYVEIS